MATLACTVPAFILNKASGRLTISQASNEKLSTGTEVLMREIAI
jgi:hypothetical protein